MSGRRAKFLWHVIRMTFPDIDDKKFLKNRYRKMKKLWNEMDRNARNEFIQRYAGPKLQVSREESEG